MREALSARGAGAQAPAPLPRAPARRRLRAPRRSPLREWRRRRPGRARAGPPSAPEETMGTPETIAVENAHTPPFFAKTPISIERGEGVRVWDEDGRRYLDLTAGWGVTSHRPRPPGDRARAGGAGRAHHPEPGLRADVLTGAGQAPRAARRHPADRAHAGLLHQQRRGGQRRRREAGAQGDGPHRRRSPPRAASTAARSAWSRPPGRRSIARSSGRRCRATGSFPTAGRDADGGRAGRGRSRR